MNNYSLIIHGGAGDIEKMDDEKLALYKKTIHTIAEYGKELLDAGENAMDVVEKVIIKLEDHEIFNAGKGSVLDDKGMVMCDASIMNGSDLDAGAVAGISNIKNPIKLARNVMEKSEHVMLISDGANTWADIEGMETAPQEYFITEFRKNQQLEAKARGKAVLDHDSLDEHKKYGTVGAVVRDKQGVIVAGTSTGGISNMKYGRVGDSPIIGAGTWADNETCGVSCTGYGEQFIRTAVAKTASDIIWLQNKNAQEAADAAIDYLVKKVKGLGGLILIDKDGNIGQSYSTSGMIRAWVKEGEEVQSQLK